MRTYVISFLGFLCVSLASLACAQDSGLVLRTSNTNAAICQDARTKCATEGIKVGGDNIIEAFIQAPECGPKNKRKPIGTPCSCDDPRKPETCVGKCDKAGNCK
jgi:hypothetical protein